MDDKKSLTGLTRQLELFHGLEGLYESEMVIDYIKEETLKGDENCKDTLSEIEHQIIELMISSDNDYALMIDRLNQSFAISLELLEMNKALIELLSIGVGND